MSGEAGKEDVFNKKPEPAKTPAEPPKQEPKKETEPQGPAPAAETALTVSSGKELKEIEMSADLETKMLEVVRQRQKNKKELINIALQQTNKEDWVLQNGKPYLEITGAEKIAPIFGVRVRNITLKTEEGTDTIGPWRRFWYYGTGEIAMGDRVVYALEGLFGSSWTRDDFFGKKKEADKNGNKYKPLHEIDMRDLQYKAYSDLMRVAVVRLVGLRSVTLEELTAANIKIEDVANVKRGAEFSEEEKAKQQEFLQIAKRMVGTDQVKLKALTKEMTQYKSKKDGSLVFKEDITMCGGMNLDISLQNLKKKAEALDRENGGGD